MAQDTRIITFAARNPRNVWDSSVRANVIQHEVLAIQGECDWNAGTIREVGGQFLAECNLGVATVDTMKEALAIFHTPGAI